MRPTPPARCALLLCAPRSRQQPHCSSRQPVIAAAAAVEAPPKRTPGSKQPSFPFVKIAGQEDMKLALMLNVIDPNIGGVLIMGDRGTAKSVIVRAKSNTLQHTNATHATQVRALVELLPMIDVVENDAFNSSPTDPKFMGPDVLQKALAGESLPSTLVRTPLVWAPRPLQRYPYTRSGFYTHKQVELPLGATEDRICGTIDIERALTEGVRAYEPGLLVCNVFVCV